MPQIFRIQLQTNGVVRAATKNIQRIIKKMVENYKIDQTCCCFPFGGLEPQFGLQLEQSLIPEYME